MIDRDFEEQMDADAKISAALQHAANVLWAGPPARPHRPVAYATVDDFAQHLENLGVELRVVGRHVAEQPGITEIPMQVRRLYYSL